MSQHALGVLSTVAGLAGLATNIGTAAAGLTKTRRRNTSRRAVQEAASRAAGVSSGAAQQGFGASRGLALRSGLRVKQNIDAASTAAARDDATFIRERDLRNARLASFGKDAAGFAGQVAQGVVDSKAAKAAGDAAAADRGAQQQAVLPDQAAALGVDPNTGLTLPDQGQQQAIETGLPQQAAQIQDAAPVPADAGQLGGAGDQQTTDPVSGLPQPATALDAYQAALGIAPNPVFSIAPKLEFKLRVTNLAVQEAERRGVQPATVLADLLRKLNLNTQDLQGPGFQGESAQVMDQVQ